MILSEEVEVVTVGPIIKYYQSLGYQAEHKKNLKVKVYDLTKSSECIIDVSCDVCKNIYKISYARYNKSIKRHNIYCCNKCKGFKNKITCLEKYGVENISQIEEIKTKKEKTCLRNYGVKNPSNSKEIVEKIENTFLQKYGVRHVLKNDKIYSKLKETMLDNFGVEHALQSETLIIKSKKTSLMNYGVEHPSKSDEVQQKSKLTRIKNGNQIPDYLLNEWALYKAKVKKETRKNKKLLLENWDGYDFYDNEFIKDNFKNYNPRHKKYPSIDHKISVSSGFLNNISHEIIGSLNNICITKTEINCSKKETNYSDYLK